MLDVVPVDAAESVSSPWESGARCTAVSFPSPTWIRDRFLPYYVEPQGGGFVPINRVEHAYTTEPHSSGLTAGVRLSGTMPGTNYPVWTPGWASPLLPGDTDKLDAAVALVASSYTFEFHRTVADEDRRFGALFPIASPLAADLHETAVHTAFLRWLPLDRQPGSRQPGSGELAPESSLIVYGVSKDLVGLYRYLITRAYQPYVGRNTPDLLVRRILLGGADTGGRPLPFVSALAEPDLTLGDSFVFPLLWGPASAVDGLNWENPQAIDEYMVAEDYTIPPFGVPLNLRVALRSVAAEIEGFADQVDDRTRSDGELRSWLGGVLRRIGGLLGGVAVGTLFFPFGLALGPALAALVTSSRRTLGTALRELASGIREGAATSTVPILDDEDDLVARAHTWNEGLAAVVHGLDRMLHRLGLGTELVTGEPARNIIPSGRRSDVGELAALLMPLRRFERRDTANPDVIQVDPAPRGVPRNRTTTPILHVAPRRFDYRLDGYDRARFHSRPAATESRRIHLHGDYLELAHPLLQLASTIELATDLFRLQLQAESSWLAVFGPLIAAGGTLGEALGKSFGRDGRALGHVLRAERRLPLKREVEDYAMVRVHVTPADLIAFVWRQGIVDMLIERFTQEQDALRASLGLPGRVDRQCLFDVFCWMRSSADRSVLDAVLGPVSTATHSRLAFRSNVLPSGRAPLWDRLLAGEGLSSFLGLHQRWYGDLSAEERCSTWPRFLELVRSDCAGRLSAAYETEVAGPVVDPLDREPNVDVEPDAPRSSHRGPGSTDGNPGQTWRWRETLPAWSDTGVEWD